MESNFVSEQGNHIISIPGIDHLPGDMEEEIDRCTRGLRSYSARSSCCIFKAPSKFKETNGKYWYSPRIVSIGPYYYRKNLNDDYKYSCLGSFLKRTQACKGIGIEDYMKKLYPLEKTARECYSEKINLDSSEFLEMMVLDASFILGLFYKFQDPGRLKTDEPLAPLKSRLHCFYVDLLLLENQIPFFVLQELFDISKMPHDPSLSLLALRFFNNVMRRPKEAIRRYANDPKNPPLHLLDLVRSSLIPNDPMPPQNDDQAQIQFIPCISQLLHSGIRVQLRKAESFLAVKFEHGVIHMPSITINDFMRSLLLNCAAFEQCNESSSKNVTVYATFLDCLVNTAKDVEYLRERNVIDNVIDVQHLRKRNYDFDHYLADDRKVAIFINSLGKGLSFDMCHFYLYKLFNDVDKYHRNSFNVQFAGFKYNYLNSPWSCISVLAATVLLLLTLAQTYYAVIGYVHPKY